MTFKEKLIYVFNKKRKTQSFYALIEYLRNYCNLNKQKEEKLVTLYRNAWDNGIAMNIEDVPEYILFVNLVTTILKNHEKMIIQQKIDKILEFCGFIQIDSNQDIAKACLGVLYTKKKINLEEYKKLLSVHKSNTKDSHVLLVNLMYNIVSKK
jgi:hypothetical protein